MMRFLTVLKDETKPEEFESIVRTAFQQFFIENGNFEMSDKAQILEIADKAGLRKDLVEDCLEKIKSDEVKNKLKTNTQRAVDLGAFGLPSTFVYLKDNENPMLFWGCDRNQYIAPLLDA